MATHHASRFVELLPQILYLIGSACFFIGTVIAFLRNLK